MMYARLQTFHNTSESALQWQKLCRKCLLHLVTIVKMIVKMLVCVVCYVTV